MDKMIPHDFNTMLLDQDNLPPDLKKSLDDLLADSFAGLRLKHLPPVTRRAVVVKEGSVLAHAAVQTRRFHIAGNAYAGYILGFVCVARRLRHQGLGTMVTQALLRSLDSREHHFMVLNCGASLTTFYGKMGFKLIAEKAEYIRRETREIDHDPVMGKALTETFNLDQLQCDVFPVGEDF